MATDNENEDDKASKSSGDLKLSSKFDLSNQGKKESGDSTESSKAKPAKDKSVGEDSGSLKLSSKYNMSNEKNKILDSDDESPKAEPIEEDISKKNSDFNLNDTLGASVKTHKKRKIRPIYLLVLLISAGVASYLIWQKYSKQSAQLQEVIAPLTQDKEENKKSIEDTVNPVINESPTSIETPKSKITEAQVAPMSEASYLNSIEYSDQFEFPRLNVDLSKKVFYQIYESPGEITLVFPDTKANSNLIEMNNAFIKLVNVNYFKNQTTVNIVLQDDIKMGNIGYSEGGNTLQLSFQNILTKRNMDVSQIKSVQQSVENKEQSQQREYYQALSVANDGNYPKAIKLMQPLTEGEDPYIPAIESLAILYLKSLRIQEADTLLSQAIKAYPTNIKLKEYYARLLIIKKEFPEALQFLMTASPSLNQYPDYYGLIAFLNLEEQKPKVAQLYYLQLTELMPDNVKWLLGLAVSLKMQGANNAAEAIYKRILANGNVPPNIKLYVSQQMASFL